MKKAIVLILFVFSLLTVQSQTEINGNTFKEGDQLTIGVPTENSYQAISIPKEHIIRKRGGIPNMSSLYNTKVVIHKIENSSDETAVVTFKRQDGGRFFGSHAYLKTDLKKALDSRELIN